MFVLFFCRGHSSFEQISCHRIVRRPGLSCDRQKCLPHSALWAAFWMETADRVKQRSSSHYRWCQAVRYRSGRARWVQRGMNGWEVGHSVSHFLGRSKKVGQLLVFQCSQWLLFLRSQCVWIYSFMKHVRSSPKLTQVPSHYCWGADFWSIVLVRKLTKCLMCKETTVVELCCWKSDVSAFF